MTPDEEMAGLTAEIARQRPHTALLQAGMHAMEARLSTRARRCPPDLA
ncbi:MAG TPA: hypothetical protein VF510_15655 [Ktedonobacterales bacterium]